jgi:Domain of unknown function (DUF2804), N-terminal/Domain of unknown function (DUF2804), C-terminal
MQNEITKKGALLDDSGLLRQKGYSKKFLLDYNPETISLYPLRIFDRLRLKEWDYYAFTTPTHFFSATVADIGYLGLVFVYLIDFEAGVMYHNSVPTPLGAGCRLPHSSEKGNVCFKRKNVEVNFLRQRGKRVVMVDWKNFSGGCDLSAEIVARQPKSLESIAMSTPIGKRHFYYNHKINCMPAAGEVNFGNLTLDLAEDNALCSLDWGRGVWDYQTFWNWASASGFLADGRRIGLNFGIGFGDLSGATENCFFVDGKMSKLTGMSFDYNGKDYMSPWKFFSDDGKCRLTFTPFFEREDAMNLILLATEVHQMFGRYNGEIDTDDGETIKVRNLLGWAEEHKARW